MTVKSQTVLRLIAGLTLLLMVWCGYYLVTYTSYRPLILHRYSWSHFLYMVVHGVLLLPFVALAFLPRRRGEDFPNALAFALTVGWISLAALVIFAQRHAVIFDGLGGVYFFVLVVHSFLATGALLHVWNQKLFNRWQSLVSGVALMGIGVLCAIGVCEMALRVKAPPALWPRVTMYEFFRYDPLLGWANRPRSAGYHKSYEFDHLVKINSRGLRDREYSYKRRSGVKRILCLGDSFTWGHGVDQSKVFTEVMENELLQGAEVINAAVAGYGTAQQWLWLREEGVKYRPDLVILGFYVNDFDDNVDTSLGEDYPKPWFTLKGGNLVLHGVPVPRNRRRRAPPSLEKLLDRHLYTYRLARLIKRKWRKDESQKDAHRQNEVREPAWQIPNPSHVAFSPDSVPHQPLPGEEVTEALLKAIQHRCQEMQAGFLVVLIPQRQDVRPSDPLPPPFPYVYERARTICQRNRIDYLDLRPLLVEREERGQKVYFDVDPHWNEEGHRIAAEAIYRRIMDMKLLPRQHTKRGKDN
ncbi:MAG: GDSL-type esterase/lipase family protein [Abditibacteriales bacterium]|nr:GDSL-type esterase/lipase family protein [Abditibacteriales bacterium]MDW8366923.1 GDSL-type esterase/lipase family protein [Abditibacteriales bacterium]